MNVISHMFTIDFIIINHTDLLPFLCQHNFNYGLDQEWATHFPKGPHEKLGFLHRAGPILSSAQNIFTLFYMATMVPPLGSFCHLTSGCEGSKLS